MKILRHFRVMAKSIIKHHCIFVYFWFFVFIRFICIDFVFVKPFYQHLLVWLQYWSTCKFCNSQLLHNFENIDFRVESIFCSLKKLVAACWLTFAATTAAFDVRPGIILVFCVVDLFLMQWFDKSRHICLGIVGLLFFYAFLFIFMLFYYEKLLHHAVIYIELCGHTLDLSWHSAH